MRQFQIWILASALTLLLAFSAANSAEAEAEPAFEIPRLEGMVVDGDANDWGVNGFRVEVICGGKQTPPPAEDPRRLGPARIARSAVRPRRRCERAG